MCDEIDRLRIMHDALEDTMRMNALIVQSLHQLCLNKDIPTQEQAVGGITYWGRHGNIDDMIPFIEHCTQVQGMTLTAAQLVNQAAPTVFRAWVDDDVLVKSGETVADKVCQPQQRLVVLNLFLELGLDINQVEAGPLDQRRAVHHALLMDDAPLLERVLKAGAIVGASSFEKIAPTTPGNHSKVEYWWVKPVQLAVHQNCGMDVIQTLVKHGVRLDGPKAHNHEFGTPIEHARALGRTEMLVGMEELLLRRTMRSRQNKDIQPALPRVRL